MSDKTEYAINLKFIFTSENTIGEIRWSPCDHKWRIGYVHKCQTGNHVRHYKHIHKRQQHQAYAENKQRTKMRHS